MHINNVADVEKEKFMSIENNKICRATTDIN